MKTFIPDLELNELFYKEAVKPMGELHFSRNFIFCRPYRMLKLQFWIG